MNRFELAATLSLMGSFAVPALTGCNGHHVGARCTLNTDCSLQNTLVCDTAEPNGYCTYFNCVPDSCQNKAACVAMSASVPGCPYDDYQSPARTTLTMCLQQCHKDSDCRTSEGYICADPRQPPWNGIIVDDDQQQLVCIVAPDYYDGGASVTYGDAGVCQSLGPAVPPIEAGVTPVDEDAGADAGVDSASGE